VWRNVLRGAGLVILAVELRQVLIGKPVDQGLLVLATGLLGGASLFRKDPGP
jgi:hypothetical protein